MSEPASSPPRDTGATQLPWYRRLARLLTGFGRSRNGEGRLRDALEELIEESQRTDPHEQIDANERMLLTNILKLENLTAYDVMIPRADIVAVQADAGLSDLLALYSRETHSRLPVYRQSLDDVMGMVHLKDVVACVENPKQFSLSRIVRDIMFVAPSMRVLDLLLQMRLRRIHMALVVDEFGGVDGLITIEDLVETIVGEIEDEHDGGATPSLERTRDGALIADARVPVEAFLEAAGPVLTDSELEDDIDTLGGFVFDLAGRVPSRGELISHPSGLEFEVLEADPRRIKRLRVRGIEVAAMRGSRTEAERPDPAAPVEPVQVSTAQDPGIVVAQVPAPEGPSSAPAASQRSHAGSRTVGKPGRKSGSGTGAPRSPKTRKKRSAASGSSGSASPAGPAK